MTLLLEPNVLHVNAAGTRTIADFYLLPHSHTFPDPPGEKAPLIHPCRRCGEFSRKNALERVVGANPPPMLLREGVVGECLLDCRLHQLGDPGQAQATQLLARSDSLLACRTSWPRWFQGVSRIAAYARFSHATFYRFANGSNERQRWPLPRAAAPHF